MCIIITLIYIAKNIEYNENAINNNIIILPLKYEDVNSKQEVFMKNLDIREETKSAGVNLWQIAEALGVNDGNFSRKLRRELSPAEK